MPRLTTLRPTPPFRRPHRQLVRSAATALLLLTFGLSVAAAPQPFSDAVEGAHFRGATMLNGELFHVQGLALQGGRVWVTSVDRRTRRGYLHLFDRATGRFVRRIELTDGARYHPGGISIDGHSLWVPVAELRPDSSAVLMEIDTETMRVARRIRVADHLGCVAAHGRWLVAGNWDSRLLYIVDRDDPARVRTVPNRSGTRYQDMKFVDGTLVASGPRTWWSGTVDWLDWPSLTPRRSLRAGSYTAEGMAIEGRDLYLAPEDGPSRVYRFRLGREAPSTAA
ncbi:DUF6454 family protein [uncultured Sphingomonas sp.]|uniref:DUF6454 family protein n=1 Tax=uncultured Sphingomonas sp. TaxID=158754 RepID=UPI0025D32A72|nr:DUF6454 family protein [uncultured Sphingomonas sp.]